MLGGGLESSTSGAEGKCETFHANCVVKLMARIKSKDHGTDLTDFCIQLVALAVKIEKGGTADQRVVEQDLKQDPSYDRQRGGSTQEPARLSHLVQTRKYQRDEIYDLRNDLIDPWRTARRKAGDDLHGGH